MTGSLSLERGLSILALMKSVGEPIGVREVARRVEISAPAAQRLLNTLARSGFVEQLPASHKYRIGYAVLALASSMRLTNRLIELAEEELQVLADKDACNGFLGVRRSGVGVYLLCVQSNGPMVIRAAPGEHMPLHSTALGKALLLNMDDAEVTALLGCEPLESVTVHTVTDTGKLVMQLRTARSIGYTTSFNESIPGVVSVGAPVRNAEDAIVAAISVAIPRALFPKIDIAEIGEKVLAAGRRISSRLGWEDDPGRTGPARSPETMGTGSRRP